VSRFEDPQDGLVGECSEADGMPECRIDVLGGVALAQEQDAPCAVAPLAWWSRAKPSEELPSVIAHLLESYAELVKIDGRAPALPVVEALRIELQAATPRSELVGRNALEIGGIHEELALGDAYREQVGDVVVGTA
jgi:hypothetical protein